MYSSWSRAEKTSLVIFWKSFFWIEYFLYSILMSSKKAFSKNIRFEFSTLDHDLYICGTCCNYFLCSLDPEESIDNNDSITQPIITILTQEKHIFSVLSKSNVDGAQIPVEMSDLSHFDLKTFFSKSSKKFSKPPMNMIFSSEHPFRLVLEPCKKSLPYDHSLRIYSEKTWPPPKKKSVLGGVAASSHL